jgi:hypothetical protein
MRSNVEDKYKKEEEEGERGGEGNQNIKPFSKTFSNDRKVNRLCAISKSNI